MYDLSYSVNYITLLYTNQHNSNFYVKRLPWEAFCQCAICYSVVHSVFGHVLIYLLAVVLLFLLNMVKGIAKSRTCELENRGIEGFK